MWGSSDAARHNRSLNKIMGAPFSHDHSKRKLRLPPRTPAYVDRETGAAECCVSPETWDRWEKEGRLPSPAPGFPLSTPRWRWADVDRKMSGKPDNDADAFVASAGKLRNGSKKDRQRALT
jgi:hypothetical protein